MNRPTETEWWIQGQFATSPDGKETIYRAGTNIWLQQQGDPKYWGMLSTSAGNFGPGFDHCAFQVQDVRTERRFTVTCREGSVTVQQEGGQPVAYTIMERPAEPVTTVWLSEYDRRQRPASLFRDETTGALVYCSDWLHGRPNSVNGAPMSVSRLFIVNTPLDGQSAITEITIRDADGQEADRVYWVMTADQGLLDIPRPDWPGDGDWSTPDGNHPLTRLSLANYRITHNDFTGRLLSITPR